MSVLNTMMAGWDYVRVNVFLILASANGMYAYACFGPKNQPFDITTYATAMLLILGGGAAASWAKAKEQPTQGGTRADS